MNDFNRSLPRLDALRTFEAAARLGSFAAAARELNVTAPAVSQQIRALEDNLGVRLFRRAHRAVSLTRQGSLFFNGISVALTHLRNAAEDLRVAGGDGQIDVATDTSLAAMWLLPRLNRFRARHPDCSIRLTASDVQADLHGGAFQVAILHGRGDWPGLDSRPLFAEEVFPVCAPGYLRAHPGLSLRTLPQADLLDLEYDRWHWMNWAIWLGEKGLELPRRPRRLVSNAYPLTIDHARGGGGIALGWRHLVDDDLARGTLVRPLPDSVTTRNGYHIVWPYKADLTPMAEAFRDWLTGEAVPA